MGDIFNEVIYREERKTNREFAIEPTEGTKHDQDKVRWELHPWDALREIAKVWTFGAKKYDDRNWEKGFAWSRPYGALIRHITAWWEGENYDDETGISHLAHAGCCLLMLLTFELRGTGTDDRPKT